ncbi:hypothetical protein [Rubritalea sp.]|uniref:hypothetical protein n=1 Tax=Rubritalea sp. TaxID=2109375 RepID=UPI003EFAD516
MSTSDTNNSQQCSSANTSIEIVEEHLIYSANGEVLSKHALDDVIEVFAFKEDLFSTDIICIGFRINSDGDYFKIDEEMNNYVTCRDALPDYFPGIRTDWFREVAFPAFDANCLSIWGEELISTIWKHT